MHDKFEMHIYTMGTRNYAFAVAAILDPDRKYFMDRILSRDDSGSTPNYSSQVLCINQYRGCFQSINLWSLLSMTGLMSGTGRQI